MNIAKQMAVIANQNQLDINKKTCEKLLKEVIPFLAKNGRRKISIRKVNGLVSNINRLSGFYYVNKKTDLNLLKEELGKRGFNSEISVNGLVVKW